MRNFLFDLQRFQSSAAKYLSEGNDKYTVDSSMFDNPIYDTVYALGGNDTIKVKSGSYGDVTVYGGAGNDSLVTEEASTLLEGNEDDDTITAWNANSSTLDGGAGDDVIENRVSYSGYDAKKVIIKGGAGADKIYSQGYQATIDGGNDNDEITSSGSNSSINGGAGNDKLTLEDGSSLSIRGGKGDDTIYAKDNLSNLYQYAFGDGNDTIIGITDNLNYYGTNLNAFDTLAIYSTQFHDDFIVKVGSKMAGNTYTSSVVGNDLVFDIGSGAVTFKNSGKAGVNVIENDSTDFKIRIFNTANGAGVYYTNDHEGAIIHGLRGNDTIKDIYDNSKARKTDNIQVFGFDGDDLIENDNSFYATLDGGDGDDTIKNSCTGAKIYTGNGGNFVSNLGGQALITGGADKDTISTGAISVTIKSGAGDDSIVNRVSDFRETNNGHCSIDAGDGNDYIYHSYNVVSDKNTLISDGDESTLYGGAGNDTIYNDGNYNTIIGGKGDDSIVLSGALHNVIVYANGDGNDTIKGLGLNNTLLIDSDYSSVRSSNGSDIIVTVGNGKITLVDGEGTKIIKGSFKLPDDTTPPDTTPPDTTPPDTTPTALNLENRIASTLITATKLDDTIENYASSVTINGAEGADSITNLYIEKYDANGNFEEVWGNGDYASINGGDGDDYISNYGARATIRGGNGDDTIDNNGIIRVDDSVDDSDVNVVAVSDEFLIDGGNGNDNIWNINSGATLLGGANDDYIFNSGDNVSIDGGTGNDHITNYGDNLTITGGSGNDIIFNTGYSTVGKNMLIKYKSGDGDDVIYGDETATLQIGNGTTDTYSKATVDGNLIVTVGEGKITLVDMATTVFTILGTEENSSKSTIYDNSSAAKVTLASGIEVGDASSRTTAIRIVGNELDNSIVGGSKNDTLSGGSGDDKLLGGSGNDSLSGGDGKDTLSGGSGDDKLLGGSGNDSLSGGDGKDTLSGGSGDDKLLGGSGNDSLSGGDGKDTLSGGSGDDKLLGGSGNDSLSGGDGKDTLSGGSGDDKLLGGSGNDSLNGGNGEDTLTGGSGNDILIGGKGNDVFIYSAGNDTITDYAVGDKISLGADITKTTLNDSDVVFTIGKGSLTIQKAKGKILSLINSKGKEYSTLVSDSFTVTNSTKSPAIIESFVKTVDASSRTKVIAITGNALANSISGGTKNDSIYGAAGNDSILGNAGNDKLYGDAGNDILLGGKDNDSLWGGAGNDTLTGNDGNDIFIYESGKDFITDYTAGQDKIQIASGKISKTSLSGSDVLFTIGKGSLTVKNAKGKTISLLDSTGKASSIVVGAQALTNSNKASVTIGADMGFVDASKRTKVIAITGNALANSISGGTKNDSIFGAAGNDSIIGNAGNDKLYGDAGNDILLGGKDNDSLWGGAGNDTLTGNDGNDIFIYESGKDFITDYTAGQDKIQIASGKISKTSLSGSDVLFTIGKGSLTVKNAKGKTISLLDSTGKASSIVVGAQALTNSNKASVTIGADMGFVDASKRTKVIAITGNALANSISGGTKNDSIFGAAGNDSIIGNAGNDKLYGDAGNDILLGGKGNDSLWGDAGKDIFIYTANEGTDTIFDYETGDLLKILNVGGSEGSFKSSKYSGGDLTLTINGGGKIIFEGVASSTKFNINGSSYNISGSKLIKK